MKFRNMKRAMALLLAGAMTAGMMAGCGGAEEKGESGQAETNTATEEGTDAVPEPSSQEPDAAKSQEPIPVRLVMFGEESPRMKELMDGEIHQRVMDEILWS